MAIVINGSGTVTGLAVGGLPDGTVDEGTLATDAVTAAKIATNSVDSAELVDGAVDNSHMAAMAASKLTGALPAISGASLTGLTSAQMPTGSVLQVVTTSDKTRRKWTSRTENTWYADYTQISTTITPTSASSYLLVFINISYGCSNGNAGSIFWRVKRDSTLEATLNGVEDANGYGCFDQRRWTTSTDEYNMAEASVTGVRIASNSTSATTFSVQYRIQANNEDMSVNRDGSDSSDSNKGSHSPTGTSNITIMEISS